MTATLAALLLPGLMCDQRIWAGQMDTLAPLGARAIPGYNGANTLQAMAAHVLAAAPPRFALAGHSMGARVALEVVRAAPDRVVRLALLDTGTHPVQPGEADKRYALLALGRQKGVEALVDAWLPPMVSPRHRENAALVKRMRDMAIEAGVDQFAAQIAALLSRPELESFLPTIAIPTLVGVGRDDEWSPISQHQDIVAAIPNSHLTIFENAGHMAPMEAPEAVTAALKDWLVAGQDGDR